MTELELLFEGKFLKDPDRISDLNIGRNYTLHISFRLRGGAIGRRASSSSKPSFRDVIDKRTNHTQLASFKPAKYMVEKSKQLPSLEMEDPRIDGIFKAYSAWAIICRFNGL